MPRRMRDTRVAAAAFGAIAAIAAGLLAGSPGSAVAAEFKATADAATILYDAPSNRAKPLFVLGRDTPLEVIVALDGWVKVRDVGGSIGWVEKKAVGERRIVVVRVPLAEVRAAAEDTAPIVFRAELNVLLEVAEAATSAAAATAPGWIKVRHRDGQAGFVRLAQVFGI
jgi:SH3-like domain-containing protein